VTDPRGDRKGRVSPQPGDACMEKVRALGWEGGQHARKEIFFSLGDHRLCAREGWDED